MPTKKVPSTRTLNKPNTYFFSRAHIGRKNFSPSEETRAPAARESGHFCTQPVAVLHNINAIKPENKGSNKAQATTFQAAFNKYPANELASTHKTASTGKNVVEGGRKWGNHVSIV